MSEKIISLLAALWLSYIIVTDIYQLLLVSSIYPYIVDVSKKVTRRCYKILKASRLLVNTLFTSWSSFRLSVIDSFSIFVKKSRTCLIEFFSVSLSTRFHNFFTLRIKNHLGKLKSKSLRTHLSDFFYFYFRRFIRLSYRRCYKLARRIYMWYNSLEQEHVRDIFHMYVFVACL